MKGWQIGFYLFVAFMAFFPFDFGGYDLPMQRTLDGGHILAFALFAYLVYSQLRRRVAAPLVLTALICFPLVGAVELLQPFTGRSSTWLDFWNSSAGIALTLGAIYLYRTARYKLLWAHGLLSLLLVGVAFHPAFQAWHGEWWRAEAFPLLGDFEEQVELQIWRPRGEGPSGVTRVELRPEHASTGRQSLRVDTVSGDWSGVYYVGGLNSWRGYRRLRFDIFNPGDPFQLECRIDDDRPQPAYTERFTRYFSVAPGWNHFTIPLEQVENAPTVGKLNLGAIEKMLLVTEREDPPRTFYLDNVGLE